jgi:hypothetical protein
VAVTAWEPAAVAAAEHDAPPETTDAVHSVLPSDVSVKLTLPPASDGSPEAERVGVVPLAYLTLDGLAEALIEVDALVTEKLAVAVDPV